MGILFIEFPDLQFHIGPMIDSVYITGTCSFRLYFFFCRDFAVPLSYPLFDPAAPFIAISLHMAHPAPPPVAPAVTPPASSPQVVLSLSLDDEDPSKASVSSSSSSSGPSDDCTLVEFGIASGFLSSAYDQRQHSSSLMQCIERPSFATFMTLGHRFSSFSFCISQRDGRQNVL